MTDKYLKNVVTLKYFKEKCVGCGRCTEVCPRNVFVLNDTKAELLDKDDCMECGACARNCPAEAISVINGVGCATGLIYSAIGKKKINCCSSEQSDCCGR